MTPIVVTNSSPSGRIKRVSAPASSGGGGSTLLANFLATDHTETSGNLDRWTQNGVEGYNRVWVQRAAFDGASPSGTHAYRMRYGDSVGNVPGGAANGNAEFGLVFPADYGPEAFIEWKLFIPDGSDDNGPALNFINGQGGSQIKLIRIWTLKDGETISAEGYESYAQGTNLGCSEFFSDGLQQIYNLRNWNGGDIISDSGGPDQYYVIQHPASGTRDSLFKDAANVGRWVTVRCRYKLATEEVTDAASPSNGISQTWIDGVLTNGSGTDYRSYPGPGISLDMRYAFIMGPRDVTTYPDEVMWIDDVRVYQGGFPSWNITRDFNGGTNGASVSYVSGDAFDDLSGSGVYDNTDPYEGAMCAKLQIADNVEGFGAWGGAINFPEPVVKGQRFWLQLYVKIPASFLIETPGNGSLKYLRLRQKKADTTNAGFFDLQMFDQSGALADNTYDFRMIKEVQDDWQEFGADGVLTRDTWHRHTLCIDVDNVAVGSGGTGRVRFWQNGTLLVSSTTLTPLINATDYMDSFYLFTYWNGFSPQAQHLFVDKIQMSTDTVPTWASGLTGV